jgi:serine/threonine-protein kinase HipA
MSRRLLVSINDITIGELFERSGLWSFTYASAWLSHPERFALSPRLPLVERALRDGASKRPVQWYFDNLLPEETQRTLLAKDAKVDAADAFALLEWYGAESAGSLTLRAADSIVGERGLHALPDHALDARIRKLPSVALTHDAIKRMSLAGAQHKLAVVLHDDTLFEPAGDAPSTHILKPDHPSANYPHSAVNEWFVMKLAKRLGLNVPNVHRRYVPAPVYVIDRFDRARNSTDWYRRHAIDACQLLGMDRSFKYSAGSIETLAAIANATRSKAVTRARLFGWLVFNVLIGNGDAHLKNLSFLVSVNGIELAPFYDLLSTTIYDTPAFDKKRWPNGSELAWPVFETRYFSDVSRGLLVRAAETLGLRRATAVRVLEQLCCNIEREAQALYDATAAENGQLLKASKGLVATLAGEERCLRTLQFIVIKEMAAKLAQG